MLKSREVFLVSPQILALNKAKEELLRLKDVLSQVGQEDMSRPEVKRLFDDAEAFISRADPWLESRLEEVFNSTVSVIPEAEKIRGEANIASTAILIYSGNQGRP